MIEILLFLVTVIVLAFAAGLDSRIPPGGHWWSSRRNKVILLYVAIVGIVFVTALSMKIHRSITYSRSIQTVAEIRNIELALTKILSDAGRGSLRDLFEPGAFNEARDWYASEYKVNAFEASVAVYTRATYALLQRGREAQRAPAMRDDPIMPHVRQAFQGDIVRNLGLSYFAHEGNDPWGNPYQVFPGPWPDGLGPVLFRRYWGHPEDDVSPADRLTLLPVGDPALPLGIPAPSRTTVYIWSLGKNGVSDQPRYDPTHQYAPPARQHYRSDAPDEYLGGGDDVNNWDTNQTFMQFYS